MKNEDIIRAWKDDAFRESLSDEEQAMLPANPAGMIELSDQDLLGVTGAEVDPTSPICVTISWVTVSILLCQSWGEDGGTCEVLTLGCCS